jgi:hypothetical protein
MSENQTVRKMGLKERSDIFLLRYYQILIGIVILVIFLLSVLLPVSTFIQFKGDLMIEVNPTIVNGILTTTAIVFGFIAFELRDIKSGIIEKFLLSVPLLVYMMYTLEWYFIGAIVGKITEELVLRATANCLFNILYIIPLTIVKATREEIERKKTMLKNEEPQIKKS